MDSKIKNVVFDLGGVLINLDFDNCLNAFRKAGFRDIEKQACQFRGKGFFSQFELGEISPEEFRKAIRKEVSEALSDHEIDDMWNLMLLDIPREKLDLLLSFEMHKAKPEKDIYEQMMKEANILPEETFFIDDSAINCQAAISLGIQSYHYHIGEDLSSLFE